MALLGHWISEGPFDNMGALLDAVGVTDEKMRGMIMGMRPELNLSKNGDEYQLQMITPHVTKTVAFKNGDTVDQTSIVGKTVKSEMKIEGNEMTETHSDPNSAMPSTVIHRVATGDEMLVTLQGNGTKAVGKYKRS